jgi:hypothetical protein
MPDVTVDAVNAEVAHETSDVNVRGIVCFAVGLAAFLVVSSLVLVLQFAWYEDLERRQDRKLPDLARRERVAFPRDLNRIPGPRLQESEEGDLVKLRAAEEAALNRSSDGRVPIAEAMKQMSDPAFAAKHGIRVRPEAEREKARKLEQTWPAKGGQP